MSGRGNLEMLQAVSAGGVVYRTAPEGVEVVLLRTPHGVWGLPKGTPDEGETLLQAALREVREETGLEVNVEEKVGTIEYWFVLEAERRRLHKFVHFWLMQPVGGSLDGHDHEHVAAGWFRLEEAVKKATYANTVEILQQAASVLQQREPSAP